MATVAPNLCNSSMHCPCGGQHSCSSRCGGTGTGEQRTTQAMQSRSNRQRIRQLTRVRPSTCVLTFEKPESMTEVHDLQGSELQWQQWVVSKLLAAADWTRQCRSRGSEQTVRPHQAGSTAGTPTVSPLSGRAQQCLQSGQRGGTAAGRGAALRAEFDTVSYLETLFAVAAGSIVKPRFRSARTECTCWMLATVRLFTDGPDHTALPRL